nr:hypothetical protein Itr_chr10CG14630 [Ipomoea trifida]
MPPLLSLLPPLLLPLHRWKENGGKCTVGLHRYRRTEEVAPSRLTARHLACTPSAGGYAKREGTETLPTVYAPLPEEKGLLLFLVCRQKRSRFRSSRRREPQPLLSIELPSTVVQLFASPEENGGKCTVGLYRYRRTEEVAPSRLTARHLACTPSAGGYAKREGTETLPTVYAPLPEEKGLLLFLRATVVAAPWILAAALSSPPSRRWASSVLQGRHVLLRLDVTAAAGELWRGAKSVSACGISALYMDDDGVDSSRAVVRRNEKRLGGGGFSFPAALRRQSSRR